MKVSRCDSKYQPFRFLQAFRRSTNSRNSPLNFPETHKTALESCASSRLCEQFDDSGKKKKAEVRNPPHDLTARVLGLGHRRCENQLLSTKSCSPLRAAAVQSVRTSRTRSSCRGVEEDEQEADWTLVTPRSTPLDASSVRFVASDQPTRTGVSPPPAACEVRAARCWSQDGAAAGAGRLPVWSFRIKCQATDQ